MDGEHGSKEKGHHDNAHAEEQAEEHHDGGRGHSAEHPTKQDDNHKVHHGEQEH